MLEWRGKGTGNVSSDSELAEAFPPHKSASTEGSSFLARVQVQICRSTPLVAGEDIRLRYPRHASCHIWRSSEPNVSRRRALTACLLSSLVGLYSPLPIYIGSARLKRSWDEVRLDLRHGYKR